MSTFFIYFLAVTLLFVIYMGVIISMDLLGGKGRKSDESETFSTDDVVDEEPAVIDETDDDKGYSISRGVSADDTVEDSGDVSEGSDVSLSVVDEGDESPSQDDSDTGEAPSLDEDDDSYLEEESESSRAYYERLKLLRDQMTSISPVIQDDYSSDDFAVIMSQPLGHGSRILRKIINME